MASSGSINYTQTADEIIDDAHRLIGVVPVSGSATTSEYNFAAEILNKMIKAWSGKGLNMWATEEVALIFDNDVVKYDLADKQGAGSKTGSCISTDGLVQTTFSADEASGQTILSVTDSTGMAGSDIVIIELDSGARHESTIASVDSSTQITIDDALASAASSGNYIFAYAPADEIDCPQEVRNVRLVNEDGNEIPLRVLSRQEYMNLSDKTTEGSPYAYYFDKLEGIADISSSNPVMYVYTEPDNLREYLKYDVVKALDDVDASTDNLYFPDEWLEAITYNLAVRLTTAYGKEAKLQVLAPLARDFLDDAIREDSESTAVKFRPEVG